MGRGCTSLTPSSSFVEMDSLAAMVRWADIIPMGPVRIRNDVWTGISWIDLGSASNCVRSTPEIKT